MRMEFKNKSYMHTLYYCKRIELNRESEILKFLKYGITLPGLETYL